MTNNIGRYDYAFDPEGMSWPARLLRQVPTSSDVLELGPGTGAMTKTLLASGHRVTVIENDPESVALLQELDCQVIEADLDDDGWIKRLTGQHYDAILACDVLEHLRQPERVLRMLRQLTSPECTLIISIPNIAYAGVVAGLCQGLFEYTEKGVLDRTHLKFFTRRSFERLLHEQGWAPFHWESNEVPVERSEFVWQWQTLPSVQRQFLTAAPYADVYQWMAVATPVEVSLVTEIRHARADARKVREQFHALMLRHEDEQQSLREHQRAFAEAKRTIAEFERERNQLHEELEQQRQELARQYKQAEQHLEAKKRAAEQLASQEEQLHRLQEAVEHLRNHSFSERILRSLMRRIRG